VILIGGNQPPIKKSAIKVLIKIIAPYSARKSEITYNFVVSLANEQLGARFSKVVLHAASEKLVNANEPNS
jgi:hypothetical protein